jgi:hypothetical protein
LEAGVNTEEAASTNLPTKMIAAPPDSAPAMTVATPDSAEAMTAAPPDSAPTMTAALPDSAHITTVALPDSAPAMTAVPFENMFTFELDDTTITKDDAVASGLPVGAAESEPAKKKVRTDFGFGAQRWGNQLGGNPVWTIRNSYIHSKDLEGRQCEVLFMAYQHITRVHGRTLPPKELYMRVTNLFNIGHWSS